MSFAIKATKKGPKSVPTPPSRPSFVLGSRPPGLRSPRIEPLGSKTRQYGKSDAPKFNVGFGDTGQPET